ncbi:Hypothetical predicted protein [Mytilus galloprovincialis]|uniref:DUF6589 domain-containing protein n=2 Tax=Mytilus galloprovincialis TaxID=29158 RepID=A0A8B6GYD0_MYTGA|nr:Hypothetical predicted protein [Mytilus galloprovincialis]
MEFSWNKLKNELVIRAPGILKIISAIVSDIPSSLTDNRLRHVLQSAVIAFHGRSREMSTLQYIVCMIQAHGGCTNRDIERLVKIGLSVHPSTLRSKLASWQENLDSAITELKEKWQNGESGPKYQLVGDNWDKNIVPSYRTTQQKTVSIHLFNVIAVEDRITPIIEIPPEIKSPDHMTTEDFIPSIQDQLLLRKELTFIIGNAVVANLPQLNMFSKIYPKHFPHKYSDVVGRRTNQYPLGLFDCNETKNTDVIRLLQDLSKKYVPYSDEKFTISDFHCRDRLTDERVQSAQEAMANADNPFDRLEGFISKVEDWHRLMNFLEAICKLTFSTSSAQDRGTAYYYRNLLNARNVKHEVKNSYRAYKHLYYTIFDAICCIFFLKQFNLTSYEDPIPFPPKFAELKNVEKIEWVNSVIEMLWTNGFLKKQRTLYKRLGMS